MTRQPADRWSICVGRAGGVPVRVHASLLVTAVLITALTAGTAPLAGAILLGVIVGSALLHEAAHQAIAARLMGGQDAVVLTPIGGLRLPVVANDPEIKLLVGMVGPLVNLFLVVVSAGVLAYTTDGLGSALALENLRQTLTGDWRFVLLKTTLWVNWLTFLLSLIPAFPFDGGPALRAALWPLLGQRTAAILCAQLARAAALGLLITAALVLNTAVADAAVLASVVGTLGVCVLCSAQYELKLAEATGGVSLGGLLEHTPAHAIVRSENSSAGAPAVDASYEEPWATSMVSEPDDEYREDAAVDDILARLHHGGEANLSEDDRRVLERASERYRRRRRQTRSD